MPKVSRRLEKVIPYLLVIGGVIGLICSFIISLDKVKILENPAFQPNCNLNPVVSCGNVMRSAQGSVFGFPNPWIGLLGFGVLITVGMSIFAGAKFKRWYWATLHAFIVLGLAFAFWLLYESVYSIHALCPYCLTVDVVVITLFWYISLYNLQTGVVRLPKGKGWEKVLGFIQKHHLDLLILWFVIIIFFVIKHFWYYFGRNF